MFSATSQSSYSVIVSSQELSLEKKRRLANKTKHAKSGPQIPPAYVRYGIVVTGAACSKKAHHGGGGNTQETTI